MTKVLNTLSQINVYTANLACLLDLLAHSSTTPIGLSSAKQMVISKALNVKTCYLIFTSKIF